MHKTFILKSSLLESLTRHVEAHLNALSKQNKELIGVSYLNKDKSFIAIITYKQNGK